MNISHHNHHHMMHGNMSLMGMTTEVPALHHHEMTSMASGGGHHHGHGMSGHDMSGHDMSGHDMHMNMSHGMKMYFHTGVSEYVLFEDCETKDTKQMVIACVVIFLVAVMYEGLKFVREVLLQRAMRNRRQSYYLESTTGTPSNSQEKMILRSSESSVLNQMLSCSHAIQTVLHVIQIFVSYCLMLVFMTYNVWLCVAVVVGAGVGYFIFGWKRAVVVDSNEHCH